MQRFGQPETHWDQHKPLQHPRPREARWMDAELRERSMQGAQEVKSRDDLQNAVQQALRQDTTLRSYGLEGMVIEGTARVQGVVDTLAEKQYIRELMTAIPGIQDYQDGVSVSTDGAIADKDVEMEIGEELHVDPGLGGQVGVKVREGTAFLLGRVPSLEMEAKAINLASRARGVISVISQLSIEPQLEDIE